MTENEFSKYVDEMNENIRRKLKNSKEQLEFYSILVNTFNKVCDENIKQQEAIDKAIEYCDNNKEFAPRLEDVLDILKEVSE